MHRVFDSASRRQYCAKTMNAQFTDWQYYFSFHVCLNSSNLLIAWLIKSAITLSLMFARLIIWICRKKRLVFVNKIFEWSVKYEPMKIQTDILFCQANWTNPMVEIVIYSKSYLSPVDSALEIGITALNYHESLWIISFWFASALLIKSLISLFSVILFKLQCSSL